MEVMSWIWLGIIIGTVVLEILTADLVSIWFTFGAILPFILSETTNLHYGWQIVIFVIISAILIASLRKITMRFLLKNSNTKTNKDALIGQKYRMLEETDFDTVGKIKIKDLEWSAVGDNQQTIKKGAIVEIINISGNKLLVREVGQEKLENTEKTKEEKNKQ